MLIYQRVEQNGDSTKNFRLELWTFIVFFFYDWTWFNEVEWGFNGISPIRMVVFHWDIVATTRKILADCGDLTKNLVENSSWCMIAKLVYN